MVCHVAAESGGSSGGRRTRGAGVPRPGERGGCETELMRREGAEALKGESESEAAIEKDRGREGEGKRSVELVGRGGKGGTGRLSGGRNIRLETTDSNWSQSSPAASHLQPLSVYIKF